MPIGQWEEAYCNWYFSNSMAN